MNLLAITTHDSHSVGLDAPVLRTEFRREETARRRMHRDGAHRNSSGAQWVRLEFHHARAGKIEIAGSFNDWRPGPTWMIPLGGGRWVKDLMLPPGRYEYCFVVDGHWMAALNGPVVAPAGRAEAHAALAMPQVNGHLQTTPRRTVRPSRAQSTGQRGECNISLPNKQHSKQTRKRVMARKQTRNTDTRLQTFSLTAPEALSVMLVGDFTQWQDKPIRMVKREGGLWTASVNLPPGSHHYRFLVDGQWRDDPENPLRVPNPYGGENSVRAVG